MGSLPLSPARFHNLQVAVILSAGLAAAVTACTLHFVAFLVLVVLGSFSYCFFRYLFYDLEASAARDRFSRLLSDMILFFASGRGGPEVGRAKRKCVLVTSKGTVPLVVHRESQKLMKMVCRDFVLSWYGQISSNPDFLREVVGMLDHVALQVSFRIQHIDHHDLVLSLLAVIQPYLLAVNDVGLIPNRGKVVFNIEHPDALLVFEQKPQLCHRALATEKSEMDYLRKLVDTFVCAAIPAQYKNCDIACRLVREILVYNLFKPLVDLFCSPGFIMQAIPKVLTKATDEQIKNDYADMEKENKVLAEELTKPLGLLSSLLLSLDDKQVVTQTQNGDGDTSSQLMSTSNTTSESRATEISPWPEQGAELIGTDSKSASSLRKRSFFQAPKPSGPLLEVGEGFEQSGEMVLVDFPPVYISRHVTVEIDRKQHIGYIIKFPQHLLSAEDITELGQDSTGEVEALKRYSEFFSFHRLLLKSEHSRQAKTLLLPDKQLFANFMSKLPFTSDDFDPTVILTRKEGLGNYIQNLFHIKEIRESKLFHDFLLSGAKYCKCAKTVRNSKELPQPSVTAKSRRWSLMDWMKTSVADEQPKPPKDVRKPLAAYLENNLPLPYNAVLMSSNHTYPNDWASTPSDRSPPETSAATCSKMACPTQSLPIKFSESGTSHNATTSLPLEITKLTQPHCKTSGIPASGTGSVCEADSERSDLEPSKEPEVACTFNRTSRRLQKLSFSDRLSHHWHSIGLLDLYQYVRTGARKLWTFVYLIVHSFFNKPVTPETLMALAKEQEKRSPLANCLLCLVNEATRNTTPELWITNESSQLALLGIFGKTIDTYLWKELDVVVKDDRRWARALYNLRHTVWPGGKLDAPKSKDLTLEEREMLLKQAVTSVQEFLPSALPYIIGRREYDDAVNHCLHCLLNPRINKHFLYKLIDVLMPRLIPELNDRNFQQELMLLRTHPFYLERNF